MAAVTPLPPPDGEELLALIRRQSAERRADPRAFVCEFMRSSWLERTQAERREDWSRTVESYPWYAEDVLVCMDAVLADPPDDLRGRLADCGGVWLDDQAADAPVGWLRDIRREFGEVYDAATGGS